MSKRLPEGKLWDSVRTQMWVRGDRLERIENGLGDGFPDVNGCIEGEDVWVELKAPTEPKRATTPLMSSNHKLLQSQINWFARQRQAQGIAYILVRTDRRLILINGTEHADEFNSMTVTRMCSAALFYCSLPIGQPQWRMIRNVIFTASRHRRLHQHTSAQRLLAGLER